MTDSGRDSRDKALAVANEALKDIAFHENAQNVPEFVAMRAMEKIRKLLEDNPE